MKKENQRQMRNGKSKRNNEKGKREEKEKKKNRSTPPKYNVTDTRGKKEREREREVRLVGSKPSKRERETTRRKLTTLAGQGRCYPFQDGGSMSKNE